MPNKVGRKGQTSKDTVKQERIPELTVLHKSKECGNSR